MPSLTPHNKVLIVGAGPVGMLSTLMLSQRGISVEILEAANEIDHRPRGVAYGAAAIEIFKRAGLIDEIRELGVSFKNLSWARLGGDILAKMDVDAEHGIVVYPVGDLTEFLKTKLPESCKVHWNHRVTNVGSDDQEAWVEVELADGEKKRMVADFVVGADGASSGVRHSLFGHEFPGFTWDQQLVALNVYVNLESDTMTDAQWIIDENNWGMICRINREPNFWRVVYGQPKGLSEEEMKAFMPERLRAILPNHPEPADFKVTRFSPYSIHNRCAPHMAVGRVLLAGDAAHLCNPMGGLGLTGGDADVESLVDSLAGIYSGETSLEILQDYDTIRRDVYKNTIDRLSTTNLRRMMKNADVVAAEDPFILGLASHSEEYLAQLRSADSSIARDMTQYYKVHALTSH